MKIKILTTGGTIDKIYFDAKSEYQVGDPGIIEILKEANVNIDYDVETILRKDSLNLTDEDRGLIHSRVKSEPCERILVTHGTDTMIQTANCLQDIQGKIIVLTGSMQPARLRISDAAFNIGCTVIALQLLKPGVYIVMNGRVHNPAEIHKNVDENRFEITTR